MKAYAKFVLEVIKILDSTFGTDGDNAGLTNFFFLLPSLFFDARFSFRLFTVPFVARYFLYSQFTLAQSHLFQNITFKKDARVREVLLRGRKMENCVEILAAFCRFVSITKAIEKKTKKTRYW